MVIDLTYKRIEKQLKEAYLLMAKIDVVLVHCARKKGLNQESEELFKKAFYISQSSKLLLAKLENMFERIDKKNTVEYAEKLISIEASCSSVITRAEVILDKLAKADTP